MKSRVTPQLEFEKHPYPHKFVVARNMFLNLKDKCKMVIKKRGAAIRS